LSDPEEDDDDDDDEPALKRPRAHMVCGVSVSPKQLRVTRTLAAYRARFGHSAPADIWDYNVAEIAIPPVIEPGCDETMEMGQHSEELGDDEPGPSLGELEAQGLDLLPSANREVWELHDSLRLKCTGTTVTPTRHSLQDYLIGADGKQAFPVDTP
jgi:hypothetical protein